MRYLLTHAVPWPDDPVEIAIWKVDEPRGRVSLVKCLMGRKDHKRTKDTGASLSWARNHSIGQSDNVDTLVGEASLFSLTF